MPLPISFTNKIHTINGLLKKAFGKYFNLWILLYIFGLFGSIDFVDNIYFEYNNTLKLIYLASISGLKATALYLFFLLCRSWKLSRYISIGIISLFSILSIINVLIYNLYGFGISQKLFNLVYQTNALEIKEFISDFAIRLTYLFKNIYFYLVLATASLFFYFSKKIGTKIKLYIAISLTSIGIIASSYIYINHLHLFRIQFITYRTYVYSKLSYRNYKEFEKSIQSLKELPDAESIESRHLAKTTIVVLGESASRDHLSIYGYNLPTTPILDSIRDQLYVFEDAISCSTTTYKSIAHIMSFLPDDVSESDIFQYPLLIDTFKEAGYKTYWLSNQSKTGLMSQHTQLITSHADVSKYISTDDSDEFFLYRFDEHLLPNIEEAVKEDKDKIIFVHLMGSHQEYKHRFAKDRAFFSYSDEIKHNNKKWLDRHKAQIMADYDNSIRYTDSILGKIIQLIDTKAEPSILIYLSDHGEIVYDIEDTNGRTDRAVRVPFIVFPNTAYKTNNQDIISSLKKAETKPFSTSNTIHSLLTLTGTSYSWYSDSLDVLSDSFHIRNRYVEGEIWKYDNF